MIPIDSPVRQRVSDRLREEHQRKKEALLHIQGLIKKLTDRRKDDAFCDMMCSFVEYQLNEETRNLS